LLKDFKFLDWQFSLQLLQVLEFKSMVNQIQQANEEISDRLAQVFDISIGRDLDNKNKFVCD
jgi:hypothetical protein